MRFLTKKQQRLVQLFAVLCIMVGQVIGAWVAGHAPPLWVTLGVILIEIFVIAAVTDWIASRRP